MKRPSTRRTSYVPHPRLGDRPRFNGLDVEHLKHGVYLRHPHTEERLLALHKRWQRAGIDPLYLGFCVPGTAIAADWSRQVGSCMPRTHYYDIERRRRGCDRMFLFYAEEQRHWYEELQFPIDADCVRCVPRRKHAQALDRLKARHDALCGRDDHPPEEALELAAARLELVEAGVFNPRQLEKVRASLNRHPNHTRAGELRARVVAASRSGAPRAGG